MTGQDVTEILDRGEMLERLNEALDIDPARTAVITIDCHRGHLDPEIATMPVSAEHAASVVANTAELLRIARSSGMTVIHVILQNRVLPGGDAEPMRNPFWRTVDGIKVALTPDVPSTMAVHNVVGSPQTELMPELGPEPGDIVIDTKRRLSSFRDTDLDITLHNVGADTVVLAGINTNTCIQCAAFEATNRDLKTIVISDCVQSMYGQDLHVLGLQNIARCLGWVLTLDEFAEKATRKDSHAAVQG
jgi:nicotinamidase-related amidase